MNKSELVAALAEKAGLSKKDAEKSISAFVDVVSGALADGDKLQLVGFGTFLVKDRPARTARNPRTGEEIQIPAGYGVKLTAGSALKKAASGK